jgi:hypothetical protein
MKCSTAAALLVLCFLAAPLLADTSENKPISVPFDLLITKHIVIKIKINGQGPYAVIFDTGAPVSLINTKTAKAAGLLSKDAPKPAFNLFGSAAQTRIKSLEIGDLKAELVPVIVMDHPTVDVISDLLGPVEGIIGFPFFARYKMTLDYQAKQLTFAPGTFEPTDILQTLMVALMARDKPETKVLAPPALWGFRVDKQTPDDRDGVTIQEVLVESAAAKAGLRAGDRLLTLDDRWTDTVDDCYWAAIHVKPGTETKVRVRRAGKEMELTLKPEAGL